MDRLRKLFFPKEEGEAIAYAPLSASITTDDGCRSPPTEPRSSSADTSTFSYIEYSIFLLLGISMLWAWNMFLAAGPYFHHRFARSPWISENFQAAEISVSTLTSLGSMLILTRLQRRANYPKRIIASLGMNMVFFALLAVSTVSFLEVSAEGYFGFLVCMVVGASLAAGLCQNGIFAFVAGFGEQRYTQGIMMGQAVAGVLPCVAQIVSVLSVPEGDGGGKGKEGPPPVHPESAFAYFMTATGVSVVTLGAFLYLLARQRRRMPKMMDDHATTTPDLDEDDNTTTPPDDYQDTRKLTKEIPLRVLFRKLFWLALAGFVNYAITMVFPVFTQRILSVHPPNSHSTPRLLQPSSFIPLAFLIWNTGDFLGRLLTAFPSCLLIKRPRALFTLTISRIVFVGFYNLCNIRGKGAVVESDFFFLVVVQLGFGVTNGYVGSNCMIGASEWVEPGERQAAGGFMGLCIVAGLAVGSLGSFWVAGG